MPFSSVALFRLLYFMEIWGSYKEIRSHQCQPLSTAEHSWMTHPAARPVPLLSLITQFWFSSTLACLCYMSVSPIGWDDISWGPFSLLQLNNQRIWEIPFPPITVTSFFIPRLALKMSVILLWLLFLLTVSFLSFFFLSHCHGYHTNTWCTNELFTQF